MSFYFDYNATAPLSAVARATWLRLQDHHWHNPSAPYRPATRARAVLEDYRERLAGLIGLGDPRRLLFTSGATESTNTVVHHYTLHRESHGSTDQPIAHPAGEHPCLTEAIRSFWYGPTLSIPTGDEGRIDLEAFALELDRERCRLALLSMVAANNETGLIQPWQSAASWCRERGFAIHVDASQWMGRLPSGDLGTCDWVTGSSHKSGGPKGVGFLVRASSATGILSSAGGGQEHGQRSGTENLPAIGAMVEHLEWISGELAGNFRLAEGRDAFETALREEMPDARILASGAPRLWNTTAVLLPRHDRLRWISALEKSGVIVAAGSACSSGGQRERESSTLHSLGLDSSQASRVIRLSGGIESSTADWLLAARTLAAILPRLDGSAPAGVITLPSDSHKGGSHRSFEAS